MVAWSTIWNLSAVGGGWGGGVFISCHIKYLWTDVRNWIANLTSKHNSNDKRISLKKNQTKLTIANYLWNSLIVTSQISILITLIRKHSLAGAHCVVGDVHFYECTVPVHTACDVKRLRCGTVIRCASRDEYQTVRGACVHLPLSHGVYSLSAEHFTV